MVVIAICGTPGTGKSSLAEKFRSLGFEVVHLTEFVVRNELYQGYDKKRGSYIIDEDRMINALKIVFRNSENVVVEGLGAEILPKDIVDMCIVLTCQPFVLEQRLLERGYGQEKIDENLDAERFGVILADVMANYDKSKIIIIDTTYREMDEIFEDICNELARRGIIGKA
ncbi:MAG: adenylate kinase family protein [Candidatus Njordarchaeota archaeon]